MAVKTVNAQGYDAVMAANRASATKSVATAKIANSAKNANAANSGMQDFGAMLNKAGEKTAGSDYAQASKSKSTAIRADKSSALQDGKTVEAKAVNDAGSEQTVILTDKKPAGEAKAAEAKTENANPEEAKAVDATGAAETGESQEESDNMAAEKISDALMQIIVQIKELLGVSDAELLIGLERADLQLVDLLNPANMSKLLTEAAGEGNVMSLVTNEELYAKLQELTKTATNASSQLLEELGLTQEEFDAALEKLKLDRLLQPQNADALKNTAINPQQKDDSAAAEAKADANAATETEAKLAAEIKTAVEAQTETKPVTASETEVKSVLEIKTAAEPKPSAETEPESKLVTSAETEAKMQTPAETEAKQAADATAAQETVTKPVNENEKALTEEEAKAAAAKEDAEIPVQAKQPEKTAAEDADAKSTVESSVAKKQLDATVQNQQSTSVNLGESQANVKKQSDLQNAHERGDSDSRKDKSDDFNGQPNAQNVDNKMNAVPTQVQASAEAMSRYTSENTQNILRQLADIVRVARNENLTQMEMQLHPASLGTVNVSLVTKGGAVTAHFTTQNEAVKAAVEAQAVQLVNNLEAQGVKVEAVEVTVAGHQLEKNLDENGRNEQSKHEQEEAQRIQGSRRNSINLNLYDEEEMLEEMQGADDATRIAMELMAANGNSMDLIV